IVDVVASAAGLCWLKADQIISSPVPLGKGFVEIQHGTIPIPPPAVLEIFKGVPIYGSGIEVELTTPTGAAILKTVTDSYGDLPLMKVDKIGYGAGQKDLRIPNLLRILWGELVEEREILSDSLVLLSTNIDDLNPEIVGYVFQLLLEMGAKDVWITPVQMKKNRAASELSILCLPEKAREMVEIIFRETSSLGVRRTEVKRYALPRKSVEVQLPYARIKVKLGMAGGKVISISPEYEDCAQAARKTGKPLKEIYREVISEARKNLQEETSKKPDQNPSPQ
ncbi:pyridinium-3,5-bisthiocarboxylic acid mononucleotide nickel chelatase, partial [Candidatus Hakubella thermalkaliphila]